MPKTDSEIIDDIRRGSKQAYARLIDRYKGRGMALAVRMLRNSQDAEEALQDAFVRAYNALDRFEGTAKFGTWFYRILYNVCLTRIGKRKDEFHGEEFDDARVYEVPETDQGYDSRDLAEYVVRVLETLPKKYATILSLFYLQDLSHEEICEVTQLPLGTVKVHLFRARALLYNRVRQELHREKIAV
jgi:RNA polymerase sigma-70 factor (ECF subfamily)